jgi:zinc protease
MIYPVGTTSDPPGRRGLATLAAAMLEHDAKRAYRMQVYYTLEWVFGLGTTMRTAVDETATIFEARGLAMHADWHVWRLFWLLDLGRYDGDELRAIKARLADADDGDRDVRDELLRERLFGSGHPYSRLPMSGADAGKIGGDLLDSFRSTYYRPGGATLIVTGGFDAEAMRAEIEEFFGAMGGAAPAPPEIPAIAPARGPSWIGVRDPKISQPRLTIAFAAQSDHAKDRAARAVLQKMLEDRARVVREGMGATYGVTVGYPPGSGETVLRLDAALDPDKAGKAMRALLDEIAALRDGAAERVEDFVRARRRAYAEALADGAGALDLAGELTSIVHDRLPLDHASRFAEEVGAMTLEEVAALAARDLADRRMVVVLSGRSAVIGKAFAAAEITAELYDED